ncbi:hypothetical protein BJV74DRAFT_261147 [Russula compacta]|nr:hypothetical protein BJV74DRAFT_261147 [Russula compacta]
MARVPTHSQYFGDPLVHGHSSLTSAAVLWLLKCWGNVRALVALYSAYDAVGCAGFQELRLNIHLVVAKQRRVQCSRWSFDGRLPPHR